MASGPVARMRGGIGETDPRSLCQQPDSRLLEDFVADHDAEVFEVLMARHGSRVLAGLPAGPRTLGGVRGRLPGYLHDARPEGGDDPGSGLAPDIGCTASPIAWRSAAGPRPCAGRTSNVRPPFGSPERPSRPRRTSRNSVAPCMRRSTGSRPDSATRSSSAISTAGPTSSGPAPGMPPRHPQGSVSPGAANSSRACSHAGGSRLRPCSSSCSSPRGASAEEVPPRLLRRGLDALGRRPKGKSCLPGGHIAPKGPRIFVIAITASTILAFGTALALASPTKGQGAWLGRMIDAARDACH